MADMGLIPGAFDQRDNRDAELEAIMRAIMARQSRPPEPRPHERALAALEPDPKADYGIIWPFARDRETGDRRLALPGLARDVVREAVMAVGMPADVLDGKVDPSSEEGINRAIMSALTTGILAAPVGAPKGSLRSMSMRTEAPAAAPDAEGQAREILAMLRAGRAKEVTDEMMAKADPQTLFENYDLPMDEAARMARAREMGFDTSTRTQELPPAPGTLERVAALHKEIAAQRRALDDLYKPIESQITSLVREEMISGKLRPSDALNRKFELLDGMSEGNPEIVALKNKIAGLATEYSRVRDEGMRTRTMTGNFHGSPDISWMTRDIPFDPERTHDMDLAFGRSPAYTTADPDVASAYTRPGTSWGNRDMERNPGVVPLFVRTKDPFDMTADFTPDEAAEILGPQAFSTLPDESHYLGREVWDALVRDMPSYDDLELERRLIGGDVDGMLPKTEANAELARQGFDAIRHIDRYNPAGGGKHQVTIPFEGNQLRSRFARFDPRLSHLRNLSAANASALPGLSVLAASPDDTPGPTRERAKTKELMDALEAYLRLRDMERGI